MPRYRVWETPATIVTLIEAEDERAAKALDGTIIDIIDDQSWCEITVDRAGDDETIA